MRQIDTKTAREFAEGGDCYTGAEVRVWVHDLCDNLDALREALDCDRAILAGRTRRMNELREERGELEKTLHRNGFVRCDVSACNCGGWHARYGLPERWAEVKEALADAGHPLSNANGNLVLSALRELIAERDALSRQLDQIIGG